MASPFARGALQGIASGAGDVFELLLRQKLHERGLEKEAERRKTEREQQIKMLSESLTQLGADPDLARNYVVLATAGINVSPKVLKLGKDQEQASVNAILQQIEDEGMRDLLRNRYQATGEITPIFKYLQSSEQTRQKLNRQRAAFEIAARIAKEGKGFEDLSPIPDPKLGISEYEAMALIGDVLGKDAVMDFMRQTEQDKQTKQLAAYKQIFQRPDGSFKTKEEMSREDYAKAELILGWNQDYVNEHLGVADENKSLVGATKMFSLMGAIKGMYEGDLQYMRWMSFNNSGSAEAKLEEFDFYNENVDPVSGFPKMSFVREQIDRVRNKTPLTPLQQEIYLNIRKDNRGLTPAQIRDLLNDLNNSPGGPWYHALTEADIDAIVGQF